MPTNTTTPEAATTTTPAANTNTTPLSAMTGEEVASILVGLIRQNDGVLIQQKVTDGLNQSTKWADLTSADTKMSTMLTKLQQIIDSNIFTFNTSGIVFSNSLGIAPTTFAEMLQYVHEIVEINDSNLTNINKSDMFSEYSGVSYSKLKVLNLPNCREASGSYWLRGNSPIRELHLPSFNKNTFTSSSPFWGGSTNTLILLEIGRDMQISFSLAAWTGTEQIRTDSSSLVDDGEQFANNLAKLRYNIKTYIADKLQDRSAEQTHYTVTFSSTFYNALDAATKAAFTDKGWNVASE